MNKNTTINEVKLLTEEELEEKQEAWHTYYFELGISSGFENASGYLKNESIKMFGNKKDDEAFMLRDLSEQIKKFGEEQRSKVDKIKKEITEKYGPR